MRKADYDAKYIREKCKGYKLLLNKTKDADIISEIEQHSNVNAYLKMVLRYYIENKKK